MNYNPQNPVLTAGGLNGYSAGYQQYLTPNTRLTIEQQNYLQQQQQVAPQNDPYTSGMTILSQCSDFVKSKIMQDYRYRQIDNECEMLVKQFIYASVIPQVLNTQGGRIAFERWENSIKQLKQDYSPEEAKMIENMQNVQALMNDPVVMERLRELQDGRQPVKQKSSKQKQSQLQQQVADPQESGDVK